jgi:hypothetical protein
LSVNGIQKAERSFLSAAGASSGGVMGRRSLARPSGAGFRRRHNRRRLNGLFGIGAESARKQASRSPGAAAQ